MPDADPDLLDEAVDLLREAGALTLKWFRSASLEVERKGDGTPVTEADRAAERFLRTEILRRYPDDSIIGEEEASHVGSSGRTWIIDPIDGTKAFTRGVPLYSNLLAINDDHGPAIGVINLPALTETVYAGRGLGCFSNSMPAHVSTHTTLDGAYLSTSAFEHWDDEILLGVKHAGSIMRTWGDGYGFALAATGRIDLMVDPAAALWDLAPMPVIFAEAGGHFTDWHGQPDPAGGSALATNGLLHKEVLGLLR